MKEVPSGISEAIDRICLRGVAGSRDRVREVARLYQVARRRARQPLCAAAARRIAAAVHPGASVILLTGAGGPPSLPRGETDGPLGAAVLARGLALAFDARPIVVSEVRFRRPLVATLDALAEDSRGVSWRRSVRCVSFPMRRAVAQSAALALWNQVRPVAVISIERLGPNGRGVIHNAMGKDVTMAHAGVEVFFSLARRRKVLTIGVGDRGNELGFGWVASHRSQVPSLTRRCRCPCRSTIACAVSAEVVVVASVSNWGAYGMVAALSVRLGDARLLHRPVDEARMLKACVGAGARDGLSGEAGPTVDSLPLSVNRSVVALLGGILDRQTER